MERGKVRHGVGNGLDRGRVDIVVDVDQMPTIDVLMFQVLLLKGTPRWNPAVSSNTVLLAAKRGPANAIMAMIK